MAAAVISSADETCVPSRGASPKHVCGGEAAKHVYGGDAAKHVCGRDTAVFFLSLCGGDTAIFFLSLAFCGEGRSEGEREGAESGGQSASARAAATLLRPPPRLRPLCSSRRGNRCKARTPSPRAVATPLGHGDSARLLLSTLLGCYSVLC